MEVYSYTNQDEPSCEFPSLMKPAAYQAGVGAPFFRARREVDFSFRFHLGTPEAVNQHTHREWEYEFH